METHQVGGISFSTGRWPLVKDKSTLVFIHGSGGSNVLWRAQVDALTWRANTIALDLPGHGQSRGPAMRRTEDYARAVADFIQAVDGPRPIPCGLSLGGGIVQQLILDYPGRFVAGILVGTGARLRVMPAILQGIEKDYQAHLAGLPRVAASPKTDPKLLRSIMEASVNCPAEVTLGDFLACDRFDVMDRLGEIDVPVLIICGEDDKLTPPKYAEYLETNIKNARRAHIMDAGHLVPAEKPGEVNQAIVDFLDTAEL